MKTLNEVIIQLNNKINQHTVEINKDFSNTLQDIKVRYKVKLNYISLTSYYELQFDKVILMKRKSVLLNNYEKAAECRDLEHYYLEKLKILWFKNNEASEFFLEDNFIVFCYNKKDKIDQQMMEIISELM